MQKKNEIACTCPMATFCIMKFRKSTQEPVKRLPKYPKTLWCYAIMSSLSAVSGFAANEPADLHILNLSAKLLLAQGAHSQASS